MRDDFLAGAARGAEALDGLQSEKSDDGKQGESQVSLLVSLAKANGTLAYLDEDSGLIITQAIAGTGRRCYRVPSSQFETWLRGLHYAKTGRGVGRAAFADATATILAACRHEGNRVEAAIRVAKADGAYWIDMCDDTGRAIRVTSDGWQILNEPKPLFIRPRDALPLVEPTPCVPEDASEILGDHLLAHINVAAEDHLLLLACVLEMLRPDTPYPVVDLDGVQGSAKSTTQKRLRALVDPHEVPLRGRPKNVEDIWVAAHNAHLVSYENLSSLTAEQQDAFCSLATGAGHAARTLYTNSEECTIKAKRPIIINGIGSAATRPDLIDRTVHFELGEIPDHQRRTETELEAAWQDSYPRALGAVLTLFAGSLAELPAIRLDAKPRMADFAMLGCACARALRCDPRRFLDRYDLNRRDGARRALDAYPVGHAIVNIVQNGTADSVTFTMQQLFARVLEGLADRDGAPRSARGLSGLLKKITPALRMHGVIVEYRGHGRDGNEVMLRRTAR